MLVGKGTSPKGQRILKSKAYEGGTHYREEKLACFYSSKGISFSDIPEHWIIFYQVKMALCSIQQYMKKAVPSQITPLHSVAETIVKIIQTQLRQCKTFRL